jgi:hypothetical protein
MIKVSYDDSTDLLRGPVVYSGKVSGYANVATVYLSQCVVVVEFTLDDLRAGYGGYPT